MEMIRGQYPGHRGLTNATFLVEHVRHIIALTRMPVDFESSIVVHGDLQSGLLQTLPVDLTCSITRPNILWLGWRWFGCCRWYSSAASSWLISAAWMTTPDLCALPVTQITDHISQLVTYFLTDSFVLHTILPFNYIHHLPNRLITSHVVLHTSRK